MRRLDAGIRRNGGRWLGRFVALLVHVMAITAATAAPEAESPSRLWAMIIAIKDYDEEGDLLEFALNDARSLKSVLMECGVPENHVLMITGDSPEEKKRPRLKNLRAELGPFLRNEEIRPNDRVFVFFSGHGVVAPDGEIYLKLSDSQRKDLSHTALPVSEVREAMRDCRASFKLLALDCCHAGGGNGTVDASSIAPECVVLASCQKEQESWSWPAQERGIFTYWLCRALEGDADDDADGQLSVDEVYRYTHEGTRFTALEEKKKPQEPVCHGLSDERSKMVLLPSPETPRAVWTRVARQFDKKIRALGLQRILVAEFRERAGDALSLVPAPFPAQCAVALRKMLDERAKDEPGPGNGDKRLSRYRALDSNLTNDFPIDGRVDEAVVRGLRSEIRNRDADAVVLGTLELRGRKLHVQCELIGLADLRTLATAGGVIALDEERIVLMGASLDNRNRPPGLSWGSEVVDHALSQARRGNPLLRPADSFPLRIEVWSIEPVPRRHAFNVVTPKEPDDTGIPRRHLLVTGPSGTKFEIRVWNNWPGRVAMTLLDNGINTCAPKSDPPRQTPSWILARTEDSTKPRVIDGFALSRFEFPDLARPVSAARRFGEPMGLITAVFYAEKPDKALAAGETLDAVKRLGKDFPAGPLLGAVQIRYAGEGALQPR